jgi:Uma2 family endonuclease
MGVPFDRVGEPGTGNPNTHGDFLRFPGSLCGCDDGSIVTRKRSGEKQLLRPRTPNPEATDLFHLANGLVYFLPPLMLVRRTSMASTKPRALIALAYEEAAQAYLRSLPPEHFMEATAQAKQREITLESLALLKVRRPDVQVFNELLVQYPLPRQRKPGQVVPDNMVVLSDKPSKADSSYNLPLELARPFWVLEYVSKHTKRKDYEESFDKYERDLKVPYYLVFYPEDQELTLYHLKGKKYVSVKPNKNGRYAIQDLELEVALLDGWVRFWYQGDLLPLPADLQRDLDEARRRAEAEKLRAEAEKLRAEAEKLRADEADRRADTLQRRLEEAERELAQIRAQAQPPPPRRNNGPKSANRRS